LTLQSIGCILVFDWNNLETIKGQTVTFKVTIEPKQEDPTFAFGKRPN